METMKTFIDVVLVTVGIYWTIYISGWLLSKITKTIVDKSCKPADFMAFMMLMLLVPMSVTTGIVLTALTGMCWPIAMLGIIALLAMYLIKVNDGFFNQLWNAGGFFGRVFCGRDA